MANRIKELFNIEFPIIQAGMVWCSDWKLASAVSNAGGLGIIGSGSMYPNIFEENLQQMQTATSKPYAVNVPLLYASLEEHLSLIEKYKVPIVFTSAGNPKTYTARLKAAGCTVVHVVSSAKFAQKAEAAGVDAIVAEGFEAGGHNGREETTTLCLIPDVRRATKLPLIAAGGIATGAAMAAVFALGAEGVQIGSRFVASEESSAHRNFKNKVVAAKEGETILTLKEIVAVRLMKNEFYEEIKTAESNNASPQELAMLLGRGRAKKGMLEGDLVTGELEIGQVSAIIDEVKPAADIVAEIWNEFNETRKCMYDLKF